MPRPLYTTEPKVINTLQARSAALPYLEVATTNRNKLAEFRRLLPGYEIVGVKLAIEEIQSLDPYKVAAHKAIEAYKANDYNPILVEETSLSLRGLGGRPGTYIKDFCEEGEMRRMIVESWLAGRDRAALAKVLIAVFDGGEVQIREGNTAGSIAQRLRGTDGFGWDDMFIPEGASQTFAEMGAADKDRFSMRRKALEALAEQPFELGQAVFMIPEPYRQEVERVDYAALNDEAALNFAFALEALEDDNPPNSEFAAPNYQPIQYEENIYYSRYLPKADSRSIGLILTDVDRGTLNMNKNGNPIIWQFGPERRTLSLAQRADFFRSNQSAEVLATLDRIADGNTIPPRSNQRSGTVETVLGLNEAPYITSTYSWKDLGYRKMSSARHVSRTLSAECGLFNRIGKYPRSVLGFGSMPAISGWRDVLVAAAIGHHAIFTHRNSIFAGYIDRQAAVINAAKDVLKRLHLHDTDYERAARNIGAAIGCSNVAEEVAAARYLYEHAGVRLFRIYTINSDPRVIDAAAAIRAEFGDDIELFVGQVSDKAQCLKLIAPEARVDGLFFGHGGGRQCTSATNGMAVTTLEEVYSITTDERFNHVTIAVEGGIGTSMGHLLLMGVDLISYNQQLARCVIEQGDIFFEHKSGKVCMPYHGSASAPTMIIESANPALARKRLRPGGRTRNVEGKAGYRFFEEKANSMVFYINTFKHYAARALADVGVRDIRELREFVGDSDEELIRVVSSQASAVGQAYGNWM
ncbi:MAG: IMP dehydrogenase [Chloroflexi bacterium]|nr:IMP dehydrogenase [Chloroflexota bacterium]